MSSLFVNPASTLSTNSNVFLSTLFFNSASGLPSVLINILKSVILLFFNIWHRRDYHWFQLCCFLQLRLSCHVCVAQEINAYFPAKIVGGANYNIFKLFSTTQFFTIRFVCSRVAEWLERRKYIPWCLIPRHVSMLRYVGNHGWCNMLRRALKKVIVILRKL